MKIQHQLEFSIADHALVMTRLFDAPLAVVYKVWAQPQYLVRWWGPHTFTNTAEMDLRAGGAYHLVTRGYEGDAYSLRGEFLSVEPERKLLFTMNVEEHPQAWHDMYNAARKQPAGTAPPLVTTTVTFEDLGNQTRLTITQQFEDERDRDAFVALGTFDGWGQSLVKMDSLLASLATEREFIITRTLNAPPALVWQVWSDPVHLAKWWGPNGFTNTIVSLDLRTGGEWLYTMHGPDGTDYPNWMGFKEVVAQERIAYDHGSFPNDPDAFQGEITFEPVGEGQTLIQLRLTLASGTVRAGMFEFGAFEGGDQTLGRLNAYLVAFKN